MTVAAALAAATVAASAFSSTTSNLALLVVAVIAGLIAWRSKRGDFYKAVAEEKTAETERLRDDNEKLRKATDITPLERRLDRQTEALDRVVQMAEDVVAKVAEMNGSLRAHSVAMEALADRLVLDEAARGLLDTAVKQHGRRSTRP